MTRKGAQLDATGLWKGAGAPTRSPRPKMPKRLPMPGSIPTGNAHNVLLHIEHGPRDEWDRVLQIAREGLAAAREARVHLLCLQETVPEDAQLLVDFVCCQIACEKHVRACLSRSCGKAVPRYALLGASRRGSLDDPRSLSAVRWRRQRPWLICPPPRWPCARLWRHKFKPRRDERRPWHTAVEPPTHSARSGKGSLCIRRRTRIHLNHSLSTRRDQLAAALQRTVAVGRRTDHRCVRHQGLLSRRRGPSDAKHWMTKSSP